MIQSKIKHNLDRINQEVKFLNKIRRDYTFQVKNDIHPRMTPDQFLAAIKCRLEVLADIANHTVKEN